MPKINLIANQDAELEDKNFTQTDVDHSSAKRRRLRKVLISAKIFFARLPNEVLVTIFRFAVRGDNKTLASIVLVCKEWKEIASSPILWQEFTLGDDRNKAAKKTLLFTKMSGNLPLHVSLVCMKHSSSHAQNDLILFANRLESLSLTFKNCTFASYKIPLLPRMVSLLELSITIDESTPDISQSGHFGLEIFDSRKIPAVRSLHLVTHTLPLPNLCTWFSQLTKLHFVDNFKRKDRDDLQCPISPASILSVLMVCTGLTEFSYDGTSTPVFFMKDKEAHRSYRQASMPVLPSLTHFSLKGHAVIVQTLLKNITATNLRMLALDALPFAEPSMYRDLYLTAVEILATLDLRSLYLNGIDPAVVCKRYTQTLQYLEDLHLENVPVPALTPFIQKLSRPQHEPFTNRTYWLLPRLSSLTIDVFCKDMPFPELSELISSRYEASLNADIPRRITKYVADKQNLLKGAVPGGTVPYKYGFWTRYYELPEDQRKPSKYPPKV